MKTGPEYVRAAQICLAVASEYGVSSEKFDKNMRLADAYMDMARLLLDVQKAAVANEMRHARVTSIDNLGALSNAGTAWITLAAEGGAR